MKSTRFIVRILASIFTLVSPSVKADWQIVTSNTVSGMAEVKKEIELTKIQGPKKRTDLPQEMTILSFGDSAEMIQLNHRSKTYFRQAVPQLANSSLNSSERPPTGLKTKFKGHPAQLFILTNGANENRIWVSPLSEFLKTTNRLPSIPDEFDFSRHISVGMPFSSNAIVVATDYTMSFNFPPQITKINHEAATSNMTIKVVSQLVSISETNFSPLEFEIPEGYQDLRRAPKLLSKQK